VHEWDYWTATVSGNAPRSAGIGWCCLTMALLGLLATWDSGATRAVDRSYDTATRGVNYRDTGWE
jgi:hypothetical protein